MGLCAGIGSACPHASACLSLCARGSSNEAGQATQSITLQQGQLWLGLTQPDGNVADIARTLEAGPLLAVKDAQVRLLSSRVFAYNDLAFVLHAY